ncbi:MAG TPA: DnaJ domain-containing protein [Myxococcaceae bacterium]|nr:DnaJ domain-containing protein [Myxococcaceae bacterium]
MARPSLPPAAEALFRAHQDKSTGWLTLLCGGREAKLYLQHGDLVGARLGFGHQTDAQALLASGALVPPAVDLLWSRGQLGDPARVCEAAGVDPTVLSETRALASVRRVATLAEEASFMPALVEITLPRVRGARAVRAAFEALPPVPATSWVHCRDLSAAEPFLATADERTFLASIGEFRTADALSSAQSALLRALEHAGLVEILSPAEWEAHAGAERAEAARRAEEESRRDAARLALEAARASEERRLAEMRERAEAARRALEAARAAEAAWRRARDENGDAAAAVVHTTEREFPGPPAHGIEPEFGPPAVRTTEAEFHALSEDMPPLDSMPPPSDEPGVPVLTRTTLAPFEAPVPSTDPMGLPPAASSLGDEDTLVRAMQQAQGQTDPYAPIPRTPPPGPGRGEPPPPVRSGTDPYAPPLEPEARQTDPYAQALPRNTPAQGADELPTPPSQPFAFPPAGAMPTPSAGTAEARTPPGGIRLESEELVLEPEALFLAEPEPAPTPAAGTLVEELSEALRRAGSEAPPELFQAPATEAVGSRPAERTPLRLGPESRGSDPDLWKLVGGGHGEQPGSFEAALRQVDGQLEALAGLRASTDPENPSTVPLATADLDALVRASFESGEWTMAPPVSETDTNPDSGRIGLAALSGTPVPGPPPPAGNTPEPPELSAARRQELLRQARAAAEREPVASIPTPPPRSLEDAELADAIEARHAALTRDPDRFAVLGLSPGAGRDDVKRAFIELAKVFHPDRLPRSLQMLQPKTARVFDAIREAQEFLLDDVRRAEHAAAHGRGGPVRTSDPAAASEALVAGEMAMRRREYAQAEALFRQAHEADPRPATLAAAAWAIYMDPSRRSEAAGARAMMVDALKADPDCDRAHYQLGVIARVEGDAERAEKHFREAVRSNPRHLEAAQELRLLEMRRRPKRK